MNLSQYVILSMSPCPTHLRPEALVAQDDGAIVPPVPDHAAHGLGRKQGQGTGATEVSPVRDMRFFASCCTASAQQMCVLHASESCMCRHDADDMCGRCVRDRLGFTGLAWFTARIACWEYHAPPDKPAAAARRQLFVGR